jgi:hypothetical protein
LRLVSLVLAFVLAAAGNQALAQSDPMDEQRCVWRCLSNARGASDPAYHACVPSECSRPQARGNSGGRTPPPPPQRTSSHWRPARGTPYPAVAECLNENFCLLVSCPMRGQMSLELYGVENGWVPGIPVQLRAGAVSLGLTLPRRTSGDLYRWPMSPLLLDALKTGSEVQMGIDGSQFRLTLAGSGPAMSSVEDRCR